MDGNTFKIRLRTRAFLLVVTSSATVISLFYICLLDGPSQRVTTNTGHLLRIFTSLPKESICDDCLHTSTTKCRPKNNIMFLKTHKCASSTIQNILMRYGNTRNLTFVLPPYGNYLGHPNKFNSGYAIPLPSLYSQEYNIFCHHTRWEACETARIMPKDTVYISILKEPAAMYESLYNWVNLDQRYSVSLEHFLENPAKYYFNSSDKSFARNPMSFDFGLELHEFENWTAVESKISEIEEKFSLILLAEFMDESLILLRNLLCWKWVDIIAFKVNARKQEFKKDLSNGLREKIHEWNSVDVVLYEYFRRKLQVQIGNYGKTRMHEDIATLSKLSDIWYNYCVSSQISKNETNDVRFQVWHFSVTGFQLTPAGMKSPICVQMAMAENPFTDYLRVKLWPQFRKTFYIQKPGDDLFDLYRFF